MKDCQRSHSDDEARELRIGYLTMLLHTVKSQEERRGVWERLQSEINSRSAEQIEKMELERGLR